MGTRPGCETFTSSLAWTIGQVASLALLSGACSGPALEPHSAPTPAAGLDTREALRSPAELLGEAQGFYERGALERAAQAFQLVAWFAERQGDERVTVEALSMVSRCCGLLGDLQGMLQWLARMDELARESEPHGWSATLLARGMAQRTLGDVESAYENFSALWTHSQAHGFRRRALQAARQASEVAPRGDRARWAERGVVLTGSAQGGRQDLRFDAHEQLVSRWVLGRAQRRDGELQAAQATLVWVGREARMRLEADGGPRAKEWLGHALRELGEVAAAEGDNARAVRSLNEALVLLEEAELDRNWARGMLGLRRRIRELEHAP